MAKVDQRIKPNKRFADTEYVKHRGTKHDRKRKREEKRGAGQWDE